MLSGISIKITDNNDIFYTFMGIGIKITEKVNTLHFTEEI